MAALGARCSSRTTRCGTRCAATRAPVRGGGVPGTGVMQLQRTLGNAGMSRLLRSQGPLKTEAAPASVEHAIAASGRPLDAGLEQRMGDRFGRDFSSVRIHTDTDAAASARDVGALAYTVGRDVVFDSGRFAPETPSGRHLLAHELAHTIQQGAAGGEPNTVRRSIGFEVQTGNKVTTNTNRMFPRKFPNKQKGLDEFFHKGTTGVELQTDHGSVLEFETAPFRTFSDLKRRVQEAVDIVTEIKKDPKAFAFSEEKRLRDSGLLARGEKLEVHVKDAAFVGRIQTTEGLALSQYESLLKEHEEDEFKTPVITNADRILDDAKKSNPAIKGNTDNLRGLLQMIVNYLKRAQQPFDLTDPEPVKYKFRLMLRTSFSSMLSTALSKDEQALFSAIIKSGAIPTALGMNATDPVFVAGYWGEIGNQHAFFSGGKVLVLAKEKPRTKDDEDAQWVFHNCGSKQRTPGIDISPCNKSFPATNVTVGSWLNSIAGKKDALSPPAQGSVSMGKLAVHTKDDEKGLAIIEERGYKSPRQPSQPADKWVEFVDNVFSQAAACRPRAGTGTELVYDGDKKFDPKKCP